MNSFALYKKIDSLANQNQLEEALNVIENEMSYLPTEDLAMHECFFMDIKVDFFHQLKRYDEALKTMWEMIEKGYTASQRIIDLLYQEDVNKYQDIKVKNEQLLKKAKEETKLEYQVFLPEGYSKEKSYPLLIALHQGGDNLEQLKWYFKPDAFLDNDCIVVYLQSSQLMRYGRYEWLKDMDKARLDLKKCFNEIVALYSIDQGNVFVSGFSCGAIMAIDALMMNLFAMRGVIAVTPYDLPSSVNKANIKQAVLRGSQGVFIKGEEIPSDLFEGIVSTFKASDFHCESYQTKDIIYYQPEELTKLLKKSLSSLLCDEI